MQVVIRLRVSKTARRGSVPESDFPSRPARFEADIAKAARLMPEHQIVYLLVVEEDGVLVGILTRMDLARTAMRRESP
jgi:CBS-domain-containing membrane protein